ncbi:MAG: T9SS type A sorting domain-containing protein [Sphingobacteriaceae bacterium]|nr:T9SS type A sorting domain-containing protein [Sphingobacteriaceae bacterium]
MIQRGHNYQHTKATTQRSNNNLSKSFKRKIQYKSENEKIISIDIYNSIGDHLKTVNSIDEEIDLSGFSKGIYLIKINTPKGTYTNKLIKQ